jgi:hypothetical protein
MVVVLVAVEVEEAIAKVQVADSVEVEVLAQLQSKA